MATYELTSTLWWHEGREYRRGDRIELDGNDPFIKQLIDSGSLVEPGHADKLRKEREQAEAERAEREAEEVRHSDAEAHRRQAHAQNRLVGNQSSEDGPRVTKRGR